MRQYLEDAKDLRYYLRTGISGASRLPARAQDPTAMPVRRCLGWHSFLMMALMDKLCLELDACWRGAGTSHDETTGEPLLAGAGRIMHPRGSHEPGFYVDDIAVMKNFQVHSRPMCLRASTGCGVTEHMASQCAVSVEFYQHAASLSLLLTQEQWAQDALRRVLPPPVSITPTEGELILICAQRPHAVTGFDAGLRVSMQSFVNVNGTGERLTLDS